MLEDDDNTIEMINVMQAYVDGKEIEYQDNDNWLKTNYPSWDWKNFVYRIKPEPILIPLDYINDQKRFYNSIIKQKHLFSDEIILFPTSVSKKGVTVAHYENGVKLITYEDLYNNFLVWNNLMNRWDDCSKIK
jgi:hypothetical protein